MTAIFRCLPPPLLLLFLLLAFLPAASAHRLDEYLQATLVDIEPGDVRLDLNLTPGVAVAEQVLALIDRDRDGAISPSETAAYAELVKRDLLVHLDGRRAELKLTAFDFPTPAELRTGEGIILLEFSITPTALAAGTHQLALENRHLPTISVYLFNAGQPRSGLVQIAAQKRNGNQSTGEIEFTFHPPANPSKWGRVIAALAALLIAVCAGMGWRKIHRVRPSWI